MFEEITYPDLIEVVQPSQNVQVRMITEVRKDGAVIASSYSRYVLEPGADLTGQPPEVVRICNAVWV